MPGRTSSSPINWWRLSPPLASARPSTARAFDGAENWKRRLGQLILESDVIVFVLTPASAVSSVCQWEVEEALRLKKRVVPVLAAPLGDALPYEPLRDLNYIHFYPEPADPDPDSAQASPPSRPSCLSISSGHESTRESVRSRHAGTPRIGLPISCCAGRNWCGPRSGAIPGRRARPS